MDISFAIRVLLFLFFWGGLLFIISVNKINTVITLLIAEIWEHH